MQPLSNKQNLPQPQQPSLSSSHSPRKASLQPLASVIQSHLLQQSKRLFQDQIFKQSVVKCSLDKDFAYLFEESGLKIRKEKPQQAIADTKKSMKTYSTCEKNVLKCVEGEYEKTLIHVPFKSYLDCFELLHSKLNKKLMIVVTEFHEYYSEKLQQINSKRKDPIKWASLSSSLTVQTKSKILQLYELQKLQLLFLSPQLFYNQKYQSFKCNTLFISGIHLFQTKPQLFQRIIDQCEPERIIGGYEFISRAFESRLKWVNFGRPCEFDNTVWLKGINKNKNLLSYLGKREFGRVLVVVRDKKSADELSSSLSLQAYKLANLLDFIPKQVYKAFSLPNLLTLKKQSLQSLFHQSFKRCLSSSIIISPFFEPLRLYTYDLIIFYDQPPIKQYMQLQSLSQNRLGLLSDEDYYICRNLQTSSIIDRSIFEKLTTNILEKKHNKQGERKIKRFYSDNADISTNEPPVPNIKSIIVNKYCHEYQISQTQLFSILNLLKQLNMLIMMDPVKYECLIQQGSAEQFKTIFPNYNLITRRINILNLASELKTTTQIVLETMRNNNIRFFVCQELLPLKILASHIESSVETAWIHQQQEVLRQIREIDLSYTLFEQFTFPNSQFLKKQKMVVKKKEMMTLFQMYQRGELELTRLPLLKLNSVNRKMISEWVGEVSEQKLTVHDIVLFLQGAMNQRTAIYQDESIFKNYYKSKYEDLAEIVEGCLKGKRQKLD